MNKSTNILTRVNILLTQLNIFLFSPVMPTMSDVARKAGVSRYTVSKVINGNATVKAGVRANVLAACRALFFSPNEHAVGLVRGTSNTVGMIVSHINDPFYSEIIEAADNEARARGYRLIFQCSYGRAELEEQIVRHFLSLRVLGIILAPVMSGENHELLVRVAESKPLLYIDRYFNRESHYIINDHFGGARMVTEHLLSMGRVPAYLGSSHARTNRAAVDRERGYVETIKKHGHVPLLLPIANTQETRDSEKFGFDSMSAYLASAPPPKALFCATDSVALGAMHALRSFQFEPGRDVLVAGHDDLSFAAYCHPPLSTVRQPKVEIGCEAVKTIALLANRPHSEHKCFIRKKLNSMLIVRESSAQLKKSSACP